MASVGSGGGTLAARRWLLALLVLLSLPPVFMTWNARDALLTDDALITLTYSRNLAAGRGFIFNAPPAVLGTTTPLWALLCAFWHFLLPHASLTRIAVLFAGFFWLSSLWLVWFFRRALSFPPWMVLASAAVMASMYWPKTLGMETHLFLFLLLLSTGLFFCGRFFWSGFASSLLFLTRGEGILLLGVQAVLLLLRSWREGKFDLARVSRLLLGFAVPFVAWAAYAYPTFGQILPNTLAAKMAQAESGLWPSFWQEFWNSWLPNWKSGWQAGSAWLNAWIVLALLGAGLAIRRKRPLAMLLAWLALYFSGYALLGVAAYDWYMHPIAWIAGLAVAEAVSALAGFLDKRWPSAPGSGWAGLALCLAFAVAVVGPALATARSRPAYPKGQVYLDMCRWFQRNASPRESIAFFEVGYLGFYTRNPIVDQVGLVTSGAVPNISRRDFSSIFWSQRPDYLVVYEGSGFQYHIVTDPRFGKEYRPVVTFHGLKRPLIVCRRRRA